MILVMKKELQVMWVSHVDGSLRMVWCDEAPVWDGCHAG